MTYYPTNIAQLRSLIVKTREDLEKNLFTICQVSSRNPQAGRRLYREFRDLDREQRRLENEFARQTNVPMGAFFIPIILGLGSLLGIGALAWKQHESVSLEKQKLDLYQNCILQKTSSGIKYEEAEKECGKIYLGIGAGGFDQFVGNIEKLTKYSLLLIGALGFTYLGLRMFSTKKGVRN